MGSFEERLPFSLYIYIAAEEECWPSHNTMEEELRVSEIGNEYGDLGHVYMLHYSVCEVIL